MFLNGLVEKVHNIQFNFALTTKLDIFNTGFK
jgi:hypothetical protein